LPLLQSKMENSSESKWHSIEPETVLKNINSNWKGLREQEARERIGKYGKNEISREKKTSLLKIFIGQFKNILIILLLAATAISLLVGEVLDAVVILAIVVASAGLGFIQEYRSEKAVQLLKQLAAPMATVIREGKEQIISSIDIVPGDIVILRAGDKVPADIRLLEVFNLKIDEASLTGESLPVEKNIGVLQENIIISDMTNMSFSGTVVTYGRGMGVVISTGMKTEFGKIAKTVQEEKKTETPLERRINSISKWLISFMLGVCALVAFFGIIRGYAILEMILWGISLAVAAVPEALPAVVTGSLAVGMYEMAKRKAIIRRLPAVETLGGTSIICTDKTGTMTKGEMTVRRIYVDNKIIEVSGVGYDPKGKFYLENNEIDPKKFEGLFRLLKASALCNDAKLVNDKGKWTISGDTTEGALLAAATKAGIIVEKLNHDRIDEIPFTSERKRMTTVHVIPESEKKLVLIKGAPEVVLERCNHIFVDGKVTTLSQAKKNNVLEVNEKMASDALRILALAYKEEDDIPDELDEKEFEKNYIFLGLVGMIDPPRPEVKEALKLCDDAGIKVVMITGDHKLTAVAVAKELGIIKDNSSMILTGIELEGMSEEDFDRIVENVKVYARVSPQHKMKIVQALKEKGYVVAMTGDGINDATALKMADIGIAMGITGTEVTKETSDMILADDNFATIVNAVKEGRRIFDNIKKYLIYLLQCNAAEISTMLVATLAGLPIPLTAIQLLWVNLTTDGLPALALGIEPVERDVMNRKPRSLKEGLTTKRENLVYFVLVPAIMTAILLINFSWALANESMIEARTQTLTVMIVCELVIALSCHSLNHPFIKSEPFSNKFLWIAIVGSLLMQFLVLYVPFMHGAFDITFPSLQDWILAIISATIIFATVEASKYFIKKR